MTQNTSHNHILITEKEIQKKVKELAKRISQDYQGKKPVFVGILTGSFIFMADLSRALWNDGFTDFEIDFIGFTSYQNRTESSRTPQQTKNLTIDITNRDIILVEDIADTCLSIQNAQKYLLEKNPASIKTVALLEKPARHEVEVLIDYVGFTIENVWVEGYGLDSENLGRGRPEIIKRI